MGRGGRRRAEEGLRRGGIDRAGIVEGPTRLASAEATVEWLGAQGPRVVAVDSPRGPARGQGLSREGERALAAAVCGICYTPNRSALEANPSYYGLTLDGLALYESLKKEAKRPGWTVIEGFPTASWTRLAGARKAPARRVDARRPRALGLKALPPQTSQDGRDAVAAAKTAQLFERRGATEHFGDIVVPAGDAR